MTLLPDIPLDSPLRNHPKRDLPPQLASTYPHGHISGHPRSPVAQRAFQARKNDILRTMTAEEIEAAYQETVQKITAVLERDQEKTQKVEKEMAAEKVEYEFKCNLLRKIVKPKNDADLASGKEDATESKGEGET